MRANTGSHTLSVSPDNSSHGTVSPTSASVNDGSTKSVSASAKTGYQFSSWSLSGAGASLSSTTDNPTTFTMGTANATMTANFSEKTYSVTCYNGGGTVKVGGSTVNDGKTATVNHFTGKSLTATRSGDYIFGGWTTTGSVVVADPTNSTTTITATGTGGSVTATWALAESAPTVTTNSTMTSNTSSSITCGGTVTSCGSLATTRGICYVQGTSGTPDINSNKVAASGTTTTDNSTFSVELTGLSAGTAYRCRAYATNSKGEAYGDTYTFYTSTSPTVTTTNSATNITTSGARVGGTVTNYGYAATTPGICYVTGDDTPDVDNSKTWGSSVSANNTAFTVDLSGLNSNQVYSYRAMAYNNANSSSSPSYGTNTYTFTTLAAIANPTNASVTSHSATISSSVTEGGGATITERGVVWSTSTTRPALASGNHLAAASAATGSFSVTPTTFSANTTYYVWAYVINAGGTNFSSSYTTFKTLQTYTVTYNKNNNNATGTMTDPNSPYDAGATVTTMSNGFTLVGYAFTGWNTAANGSGSSYAEGATFTISGNTTLYAQWEDAMDVSHIIASDASITCGNTATLTASGISGVTYKWYSDAGCTNLLGTGSSLEVSPTSNTTYYVKAVIEDCNPALREGDPVPFSYTGGQQTYTIPANAAQVKLEVWGAQGGYRTTASKGGYGGYSVGTYTDVTPGQTLYVYVGGAGGNSSTNSSSVNTGGYNGGGYRYGYKGGGGATHIATASGLLKSLSDNKTAVLVVAGGGGSDGATGKQGMYGGGTTGGSSTENYTANSNYCGKGGTQEYSGYSTSYTITTQATSGLNSNTNANYCGGFGFGGGGVYLNSGYGGAGGGGWYGGSGTVPDGSADDDRGGGGGSGYVKSTLTDASTIAGNASMPNPSGSGNITGNTGNGYARITPYYLDVCETDAKAVTVTVNVPATPTGLTYSSVTSTTATVSWNAGSASSWQYSTNNGSTWSSTITTNSVNLTGLTPNTTINFKVKVVSGSCESDPASTSFTTLNRYTITAIPGSNGKVRIGSSGAYSSSTVSTNVDHGGSCSLYAQADDGYSFVNWTKTGGGTSTDNPLNLSSITAAAEYTANFAVNGHTVTVSGSNGTYSFTGAGVVSSTANTATVTNGGACTITATAAAGYTFLYLTDDDNSNAIVAASPTMSYAIASVTGNRNFTAHFVQEKVSGNWADAVTSQPAGYTESGSTVTISDANGLAWLISKVNGLNGQTAAYSGKTINLTADVNMSGNVWVPIGTAERPFTCTFEGNGHTITGLSRSADFPHMGLFGYTSGATIKDVAVKANFSGSSLTIGAVAGTMASGVMHNVEGAGTLAGSSLTESMGGLVGRNGGTIHSSFAVAALNGDATNKGGLVGSNTSSVYNAYSNGTMGSGTVTNKGGLAGSNSGTIENCYAANVSGSSAFAGSNTGTIQYCYANDKGNGFVGSTATAPSTCGTYTDPLLSTKNIDYMYRDNTVTASDNAYVSATGYVNNHAPKWNGLVSVLNQWIADGHSAADGIAYWYRPLTTNINGDLPVLGFVKANSMARLDDATDNYLHYGSTDNSANGIDALLSAYSGQTASIFLYGDATGVSNVPGTNVKVFVQEDAVLKQSGSSGFINTTVGITFDNSDHGTHASDYWGNTLAYDWHLMSSSLRDASIGATYGTPLGNGGGVNITDMSSSYFPNNLPMNLHQSIKWDFYTYNEPNYHWLNLKRTDHYHVDGGASISYDNDTYFTPGKGYMMAISQNTYMNSRGTLDWGSPSVTLTNNGGGESYSAGWNLVGNPYQAYLDLSQLSDFSSFYIYDADAGMFLPVSTHASVNPKIPSYIIHPHQGFFVYTSSDKTLTFNPDWAKTQAEASEYSYFRDDQPNYPLVNLFAENEIGQRDLAVIEFHRPEVGGAEKLQALNTAPFSLSAYYASKNYSILFSTDDMERIPVHFKTAEDGQMTLRWETHNGEFGSLRLIDNITGVNYDMLTHDSYTFNASTEHYSARFYITYDCSGTGIEENDDNNGASTGSATFAYINNGNIIIDVADARGASLQVIDVMGRVMYSTVCTDGVHTVSTNGFAKGVYLLRLADSKQVRVQKIMVP